MKAVRERKNRELEILIVEDSPTQAEQLRYILEQNGFHVCVAGNGKEALRLLAERKPSLVLSDIVMPEMDGYELCKHIKADDDLRDIPVILVTVLSDPKDVVKALECRADSFMTKPYDEEFLLDRIRYVRANAELCDMSSTEETLAVFVAGERHYISAGRMQILNLLLSTYGLAIRRNEELTEARNELENLGKDLTTANKELEAFTYSVSHDLRAPLRAISGFSGMLVEDYMDKLDSDGRHQLEVIQSSARDMGQLIDDLLAFSRLGRSKISTSVIDMGGLVREVFEKLQLSPEAPKAQLKVEDLAPACGDLAMIREVFSNLLSNAIKFSKPQKTSVIEVGCGTEGEDHIYSVKDNGVGFDMKYSDKLFAVFQRLHSTEEFGGTGIGLSLVQRIIHRHGGRVWAEGKVNQGATFYFTLPMDKEREDG